MRIESVGFRDLDAVAVTDGSTEIVVTVSVGPRIARYTRSGTGNLLADLPGAALPLTDGREFTFYAGHRLWIGPEVPDWSYEPDDAPVTVTELGDSVRFTAAPTAVPVDKVMDISLAGGSVTIIHSVLNVRDRPVQLAVWPITQLDPGGTALVPLPGTKADPHGLQANQTIVGWPYTDFADSRLRFGNGMVTIAGEGAPIKIGTELRRGWLGYRKGRHVFVKRATHVEGAPYVDKGASGQCYHSNQFTELETQSPAWELKPGEGIQHTERWELLEIGDDTDTAGLAARLDEETP